MDFELPEINLSTVDLLSFEETFNFEDVNVDQLSSPSGGDQNQEQKPGRMATCNPNEGTTLVQPCQPTALSVGGEIDQKRFEEPSINRGCKLKEVKPRTISVTTIPMEYLMDLVYSGLYALY